MTTAFQPNAFQSDAFQIAGGIAATDFQATIAFTQDSDGISLEVQFPVTQRGAGKSSRRKRYIANYKGEQYFFDSIQSLEAFVDDTRVEQAETPKRYRAPVKIKLSPEFVEEISPVIEYPKRIESMPTGAALAQVRRIDQTLAKLLADAQKAADEDEELCLLCLLS